MQGQERAMTATAAASAAAPAAAPDRTLAAGGLVAVYAAVIGLTDNLVRMVAPDHGLWQFHATRSVLVAALVCLAALAFGLRLRPRRWGVVAARSALHGLALLIYFGCLAVLPVAQVVAGIFTAPVFVLLFGRLFFGKPLGPWRLAGVALGLAGVVLVLAPWAAGGFGPASLLPLAAGALYALGNIVTRERCAEESPLALTLGFFAALFLLGAGGLAVLAVALPAVPEGAAGFVLRGWVAPDAAFLFWVAVMAAGAAAGVALATLAYQIADTGRVAVFEYALLPSSVFWAWMLWGEAVGPAGLAGMALIVAAGAIIVWRARAAA
jgi:drug/metabolite transporter (DMT)-like permease